MITLSGKNLMAPRVKFFLTFYSYVDHGIIHQKRSFNDVFLHKNPMMFVEMNSKKNLILIVFIVDRNVTNSFPIVT